MTMYSQRTNPRIAINSHKKTLMGLFSSALSTRRKLTLLLWLLLPMLPALSFAAGTGQLALPSGDLVAPEVVHEPGTVPLIPGQPYTISVKATDNVGVKKVLLFYRDIGGGDYKRVLLNNVGESKYSVTLPGDEIKSPGIEYYVQTEDLAGNTLLTGYSFSPLVVKADTEESKDGAGLAGMTAGATVAETLNPAAGEGGSSAEPVWKNKWLWIGVAAVAGIALASGGSSDGGSTSSTPSNGVTITACLPQSSAAGCP